MATGPVLAQQAPGRGLTLRPTFEVALSASDVRNSPTFTGSDLTTRLSPGINVQGAFGKTRLSLGYTMNALRHTRAGSGSEIQNALNSSLASELVDGTLFLDARADVVSSVLDAFGTQSAPGSLIENTNRAEVATVGLTPSLRGRLGSVATYDLRLNASATNTRRSKLGDSDTYGASFALNSASTQAMLGWGLQASRQRNEFRVGTATMTERATGSLIVRPDVDLQFTLRAGRESSDVLFGERRSSATAGAGVVWTPSPRTSASFDTDHRYFGQSRRLSLQYRTPRSVWRVGATRDVSGTSNPNGGSAPVSLYQLIDARLLSTYPDPAERDAAVRVELNGLDPNTIVAGGFVNTTQSLQDRFDLGWVYTGQRLSLSLQTYKSSTRTLRDGAFGGEALRQTSYNSTASWRLTPTASLNLTGSRLMALGNSIQQGTDLKSLALGFTDQISRLVTTSLSLRYSVFNSPTVPYRETAATAAVSLRF